MIRTKVKSLLLSVMLVMASIIFFACKDESYIKVESVKFVDQGINLIVGEEYSPEIKILPSYATDRSYTLVSSDKAALSVNGGTVKALNPARGVALRVEYNVDKSFNDMIIVNIYAQSEKLATPTEFKFDGKWFSFVGVNNAEAYILNINGQEINIGNNTKYLFENANVRLGDLYDKRLECSVRAIGDGKVFTESDSSQTILFAKMSNVQNIRIEGNNLKFDAVDNVAEYEVKVEFNGQTYQTALVQGTQFDLTDLIEGGSDVGAEYTIKVRPTKTNYEISGVEITDAEYAEIKYTVVGEVSNIQLTERVVSWDFVKNAQSYTVKLRKQDDLSEKSITIASNSIDLDCEELGCEIAGTYECSVIANSSAENTVSGTKYATLEFTVLAAPEIEIGGNEIKWENVDGAESYLVIISCDNNGFKEISKTFVEAATDETTKLNLEGLLYGNYKVEVISHSNKQNVISSKSSEGTWVKLGIKNLTVENGILHWEDAIETDGNDVDYEIIANGIRVSVEGENSCDLSQFGFKAEANVENYEIKVKAIGSGSKFDSDEQPINVCKLPDATSIELINKTFDVGYIDLPVVTCNVKIYKDGKEVENVVNGLNLLADGLDAGEYTAKAFVLGSGVFLDADNTNTFMTFTKLASPVLNIEGQELNIGSVDKAERYELRENNTSIGEFSVPYNLATRLAGSEAGDYTYAVKAIGNEGNILDSNESTVIVKKLSKPTITNFDKENLTCTIDCADADYVKDYTVTIYEGETELKSITGSNVIDCSSVVTDSVKYTIKVVANPKAADGLEYNLILQSNSSNEKIVNKLSGECDISVEGGKLIVTPKDTLIEGKQYKLTLVIAKDTDCEVKLTSISNTGKFEFNVVNGEYTPMSDFEKLFEVGGEFSIHTSIESNSGTDNELGSNESLCDDELSILGKVNNVSKDGQNIKFNSVADAAKYTAIVTLKGKVTIIDIPNDKLISATEAYKKIEIGDLKELMVNAAVGNTIANTDYKIKFVANSNSPSVLPNYGGAQEFTFQFISAPDISIKSDSLGQKILHINATVNDVLHNVIIKQNGAKDITYSKVKDKLNLDDVDGLAGGEVEIWVNSVYGGTGNMFDSEYAVITTTKLDMAENYLFDTKYYKDSQENVVDESQQVFGKFVWDIIDNASYYEITYTTNTGSVVKKLENGSENFVKDVARGICIYDAAELSAGSYDEFKLQAFGKGGECLNSNIATLNDVYKLSAPTITVESGKVCVTIGEDLANISTQNGLELTFEKDGTVINDLIYTKNQDELYVNDDYKEFATVELSGDVWKILIDVMNLIEYGSDSLLSQTITARLYSTRATNYNVLDSNVSSKVVQGLLKPTDVKISQITETDANGVTTTIPDVITWENPSVNGGYVTKFEVVIRYKEVDYKFVVDGDKCCLKMPTHYLEDANGNNRANDYDEDLNGNGNGLLDVGEDIDGSGDLNAYEQAFLDGNYTITIRAYTNNGEGYVHSNYSVKLNMTILSRPNNVTIYNGNITWGMQSSAENYVVRVYRLTDEKGNRLTDADGNPTEVLAYRGTTSNTSLDISDITLDPAIYAVTVQALNSKDNNILSGKESVAVQVIRLPQAASYVVDDGKLYVKIHKFFSKADITLTSGSDSATLTVNNNLDPADDYHFNEFTKADGFSWLNSGVLGTFDNEEYYDMVEFAPNSEFKYINDSYNVEIKLTTYSRNYCCVLSTVTQLTNVNKDENGKQFEGIDRLPTPILSVDEDVRGRVHIKVDTSAKDMRYFVTTGADGEILSLRGVHLYKTTILADKLYTIYMADIVNAKSFYDSYYDLTEIDLEGTTFTIFDLDGITYNVVNREGEYIQIDFNEAFYDVYYYYENAVNGLELGNKIDLSLGGQFIVQSQMLGDDSRYIDSAVCKQISINRYNPIYITIIDGVLRWNKQTITSDEAAYLVELNDGTRIMLYDPTKIEDVDGFKQMLESEGKFYEYEEISYGDGYITYTGLADKLRNINDLFAGGGFNVSVWAHYTNVTAKNVILAQTAPQTSLRIIPQTNIGVANGMLSWTRPVISNDGANGAVYCENYELVMFDYQGSGAVTRLSSADYELKGNTISIDLKRTYDKFEFETNKSYGFVLIAKGGTTTLDSASTFVDKRIILGDINGLTVSNGTVMWAGSDDKNYEIKVTFKKPTDEGEFTTISYKEDVSGSTYTLPGQKIINGSNYTLDPGYAYSFQVREKGSSDVTDASGQLLIKGNISGFFSAAVTMQRLSPVTDIKVVDGVLTWKHSDYYEDIENNIKSSEGITYKVVCMYGDGSSQIFNNLIANELVLDSIHAEEIDVLIYAYHNMHASTENAQNKQETLKRLNAVIEMSVINNGTALKWAPVSNGGTINKHYLIKVSGNSVTKTYGYVLEDGKSEAVWNIEIDNAFKGQTISFAIKTLSKGEGRWLNSLYSSELQRTVSASVASVNFDSEKYAIYWSPIGGDKPNKYYIGYTYNNNTEDTSDDQVIYEDFTSQLVERDGALYYYLKQIGTYSDIYVRVVSGTSITGYDLASQPTYCTETIDFNIFSSGSGEEGDKYVIKETQLENIKFRPSAHYVLGEDIHLTTDYEPVEDFSGSLDGNGRYIYGYNISGVKEYVGIFKQTNGATFTNIRLSQFNIDVMPASVESGKTVNISILVANAYNTKFDGVNVRSSTIKFTKNVVADNGYIGDTSSDCKVYIGAIAGYASGSTFNNYDVVMDISKTSNIEINATGGPSISIYVGSVVGYSYNCKFTPGESYDENTKTFKMLTDINRGKGNNDLPKLRVYAVAGNNNGAGVNDATIDSGYYPYDRIDN